MALTALQRTFLMTNLGVQPSRKALDLTGKFTDSRLKGAVDDYLTNEMDVLKTINVLRSLPGTERLVARLEEEMDEIQSHVRDAQRDGGLDLIKTGTGLVGDLQKVARTAVANKDFYEQFDIDTKTLKALKDHPQRKHIEDEIERAERYLDYAFQSAADGDFREARSDLNEFHVSATEGQRCAGEYATVIPIKAEGKRIVGACNGVLPKAAYKDDVSDFEDAAALAEPPTRDYAKSKTDMQAVIDKMKTDMQGLFTSSTLAEEPDDLKELRQKRTTLAANSGGDTIIDDDIAAIEQLRQQIASDIDDGKYAQAVLAVKDRQKKMLNAASKIADRRLAYDAERKLTVDAIDAVSKKKNLMGQAFSMNTLVEKADALASRKSMRIEEGVVALKDIRDTCAALIKMHDDTQAYLDKRLDAETRLTTLRTMPAAEAGVIDSQLANIDRLMQDAAKATGVIDVKRAIATGPNMEDKHAQQVDWKLAVRTVDEALAAIEAASKLATDVADVTGAVLEASSADDLLKIEKLVETLTSQVKIAQGKDHADQAADELQHAQGSLDEALRNAREGRLPLGQELLENAGSLLLTARVIQSEYGRLLADHKAVAERLKTITDQAKPAPETIAAKTGPIGKQLETATQLLDAHEWDKCGAALRAASEAVTEAADFQTLRKEFDDRAEQIREDSKNFTDPLKQQVIDMVDKATAKADEFNFAHARRFLDNAEARVASSVVDQKARAGQVDGQDFIQAVEKMLAAVGGEELFDKPTDNPSGDRAVKNGPELLDELVRNLPDNVPPKVIMTLAEKRFGVTMSVSAVKFQGGQLEEFLPDSSDYQEPTQGLRNLSKRTAAAKMMYDSMTMVPENSKDNPSLKTMKRGQAFKSLSYDPTAVVKVKKKVAAGGSYNRFDDRVTMKGRPGDKQHEYGDALVTKGELPAAAGDEFKPVDNTPVERFTKANVHEIGHSVDDRLGFMAARQDQIAFGGWKLHGGDIKPIADQVVQKYAAGLTDVLGDYVIDLMGGAKPDTPSVALPDQVRVNQACQAITAWHTVATTGKPWFRQSKCEEIVMPDGRVYQEAYGKTWVSYPLSERAKGVTGYQFRAPGEWFAEIYAAYHLDKLKPNHPARRWLSSLSL